MHRPVVYHHSRSLEPGSVLHSLYNMTELVVLTCASGKQCSQIIPALYQEPSRYALRLAVNSDKSVGRLTTQYPKAEVVLANLGNPEDCSRLLNGASTVYYVSPTFQPHEVQYGMNMIDAAVVESKKSGSKFSHFIFSSVLHPEITKMLNHDRKRYIEEYLGESPLAYTILQPSHFADNAMPRILSLKDSKTPIYTAPHDPNITFSFTCLRDHAEASVKVIREGSKHFFATYQILSTWPMKYTEYIQSVGDVMGKRIEIKQMPYEEATNLYCKMTIGEDNRDDQRFRDGPERMLLYYNSRGLKGNPRVLEWLLGRSATSPAELARQMLEETK